MRKICLRIDDIGASTKKFEVYSKFFFGNLLFLKYTKFFKAWGPYDEIESGMWHDIIELLNKKNAKLTVGITASWVEKNGTMIPFPDKYPEQAHILKQAEKHNLIEIASHGLTHCVVGKHLPRLFTSNRKYHREFWDWIPRDIHFEHLENSQKIFFDWLGKSPTTLIPPGNVYSLDTIEAAEHYGIKRINSYIDHNVNSKVIIINTDNIDAFHDRELIHEGLDYLKDKLNILDDNSEFIFVKDK